MTRAFAITNDADHPTGDFSRFFETRICFFLTLGYII